MNKAGVYDKAKYHYGADNFSKELSHTQAFVHTGMFIAWLVQHDLFSGAVLHTPPTVIEKVKRRHLTGTEFYKEYLDGVFMPNELTGEGVQFTEFYFDFEKGQYLADYSKVLANNLPSLYHVADTWDNYDELSKVIDARYRKWKNPWWKFWGK